MQGGRTLEFPSQSTSFLLRLRCTRTHTSPPVPSGWAPRLARFSRHQWYQEGTLRGGAGRGWNGAVWFSCEPACDPSPRQAVWRPGAVCWRGREGGTKAGRKGPLLVLQAGRTGPPPSHTGTPCQAGPHVLCALPDPCQHVPRGRAGAWDWATSTLFQNLFPFFLPSKKSSLRPNQSRPFRRLLTSVQTLIQSNKTQQRAVLRQSAGRLWRAHKERP